MTGIKVKGLEELQRQFAEVEKKAPERIEAKVNEVLEEVKEETKEKTPEGATKNLKKSFKVEKATRYGKTYHGKVYNNAPHSHLIEDGHRIVRPAGNEMGWVEGTHMLKNTVKEVDSRLTSNLNKWVPELYKELNE